MGHIFISYSHKDKDYVHRLAEAMQSEGFEVWIDDRIDYGTRWPLVIETAIDSCDAFILVASQNSHASKWVHHELSRADRLQKPIFPLLLEGAPWLSFESTQYYDIRGMKLLNRRFYDDLRKQTNKHIETVREMIVGSWPVYANKKYGFSVSYPMESNVSQENENFVRIDLPILSGTNLQEKYLVLSLRDDGILSSPLVNKLPYVDIPTNVDVFGLRLLKESGSDAGMNRLYERISYSTQRNNRVVTITLHLSSFCREMFLPALLTQVDFVAEKEVLLYVTSTFVWLAS